MSVDLPTPDGPQSTTGRSARDALPPLEAEAAMLRRERGADGARRERRACATSGRENMCGRSERFPEDEARRRLMRHGRQ